MQRGRSLFLHVAISLLVVGLASDTYASGELVRHPDGISFVDRVINNGVKTAYSYFLWAVQVGFWVGALAVVAGLRLRLKLYVTFGVALVVLYLAVFSSLFLAGAVLMGGLFAAEVYLPALEDTAEDGSNARPPRRGSEIKRV